MKVAKGPSKAPATRADAHAADPPLNLNNNKRIVLMLQGGGALGAYQVGAFEALASQCAASRNKIDWVAGISIGAINSAVIAAPMGDNPVRELEQLWDEILSPECPPFDLTQTMKAWLPPALQPWFAFMGVKYWDWDWMAFNVFGQPNFFSSRVLDPFRNPWVQQWMHPLHRNDLSFYDTRRLAATLNRHVDWTKLKHQDNMRLSLGATHVCDGEVEFFHSWKRDTNINADHVRASGALPPAFPPIQIGNEWYIDGGVSSNTPIEALSPLLLNLDRDTLVFLVDLWDRKNDVLPQSFEDLLWRQKSIQYGSRKKAADIVVERYGHQPSNGRQKKPVLEICQVMLEHPDTEPQFSFADADFSRSAFRQLRAQGLHDMMAAIHGATIAMPGTSSRLYRYGTHGKWNANRAQHVHQPPPRPAFPSVLDPWQGWWKRTA